eukprot:Opistho-2@79985
MHSQSSGAPCRRRRMAVAELALVCAFVVCICTAFVEAAPAVGGAGGALYFASPFNLMSIGSDKTVSNFPSDEITIEFWTKYVNDFKYKSRSGYCIISYASDSVVSGANTYKDDNVITWSTFGDKMAIYVLPSANKGKTFNPPSAPALDYNSWHHWAVSYNRTNGFIGIYFDGAVLLETTSADLKGVAMPATGAFVVGQDQDSLYGGFDPTQAFVGYIDELRIWSTTRSAAQIQANKDTVAVGNEPGLWGYW